MREVKIVFITYDGITSQYCGIGSISRSFLQSYNNVSHKLPFSSTLDVIGVRIKPTNFGYDHTIYKETKSIVKKSGGHISFVSNGGENAFGDFVNRDIVSKNAAIAVDRIIERNGDDKSYLVICVDIPFLRVPAYSKFLQSKNVTYIMKLHSTGSIHQGMGMNIERLSFEIGAIKFYADKEKVLFAGTSHFLAKNLTQFYGLNPNKLINLQSGILLSQLIKVHYPQRYIRDVLKKHNINTNKNLIFSMGRSEIYKGFHFLIDACSKLKNIKFQLVILCPPYNSNDEVFKSIQKQLQESGLDYILIKKIDFLLPELIAKRGKTKLVATLSLKEPFGLIPSQIRILSRKNGPVILTSNKDGYKEQISDGIDGFMTSLSQNSIAKKIKLIFQLNDQEIIAIKRRGFDKVKRYFDYEKNVYEFLSKIG